MGGFGALSFTGTLTSATPKTEIPIVEHGDEALYTTKVPRSWHEQVRSARIVRDRIHERHKGKDWYSYVSQAANNNRIDGVFAHQIKVYAEDKIKANKELPDTVEGINIEIEQSREIHLDDHLGDDTCNEETGQYDCVPGGSYLRDNASGEHGCWTATCITERNGDYYLLTSAHPYGDCGDNLSGEPTYQGKYNTKKVGDSSTYNGDYDVALVDQTGSVDGIDNSIIGEPYSVIGHVSESYCDTLISDYDQIRKMGISTGNTYGTLDEKVKTQSRFCERADVEFLKATTNAGGGDSGAPHYWTNDEYEYHAILGPHTYHTMKSGVHYRSFLPAAYALSDNLGWNVGSQNSTC